MGRGPVIFASIGSMLPFDRFVRSVDDWAAAHPGTPVFIQIGEGSYEPKHAPYARMMPHADYMRRLREARLFVAHAGMGSILQALEVRTPILIVPRDMAHREHTTDHQNATVANFRATPGISVADSIDALPAAIDAALAAPARIDDALAPVAPVAFTSKIAAFLAA